MRRATTLAGLLIALAVSSGCADDEKGFGESCDFVSGNPPAPSSGIIEFSNRSECESGYCIAVLFDRYCTQPCEGPGDCPDGALCATVGLQDQFCLLVASGNGSPDAADGGSD